jgi:hypothetical protein
MSVNDHTTSAVRPDKPVPHLPESRRGRKSPDRQAQHNAEVGAFVAELLEIRSRLDLTPGSRGWCYLAENAGMITKGEFDRLEKLLGDWRKSGLLPLDFCAEDEKRAPANLEYLDRGTPESYARSNIEEAAECWENYTPVSFWDFQPVYIQMMVEKIDLRELFGPICAEYRIPIWNTGGWSDINSRAAAVERFKEHHEAGRKCVLLYCGDHDPAGLHISGMIRTNLMALEGAVGWSPTEDKLIIDRFGLNADLIETLGLPWIEGLETGSGMDLADIDNGDHDKPYVQDYIRLYGERKVEANALVVHAEAGRQLCRDAILKYIDPDGIKRYTAKLARERRKVKDILPGIMRETGDKPPKRGKSES